MSSTEASPPSYSSPLLATAADYVAAGLSVIPVGRGKRPTTRWKSYQERKATEDELRQWFDNPNDLVGIGIVTGAVSGNLETIDIDKPEWVKPFKGLVTELRSELLGQLCEVRSPSEGAHFHYRCEAAVDGNLKLSYAVKVAPTTCSSKTAANAESELEIGIETRGEGGYVVAPGTPACLHDCNRPYEHVAGPPLTALEVISKADRDFLHQAARSFDRSPSRLSSEHERPSTAGRRRPGDDFNQRVDWKDILEPHDWTLVREDGGVRYWRRPDKDGDGISATTNFGDTEQLYVFSTNTKFDSEKSYSKFGAYAVLNHGGDYAAAARALAAEGYGDPGYQVDDNNSGVVELQDDRWLSVTVTGGSRGRAVTVTADCDGTQHTDRIDCDREADRRRFAKAISKKLQCDRAEIERLIEPLLAKLVAGLSDEPTDDNSGRMQIPDGCHFWHTPSRDAYVSLPVKGHIENWPVSSDYVSYYLERLCHEQTGKPIAKEVLRGMLSAMASKAICGDEAHDVAIRVAHHDGAIYVDLCNPMWQVVRIDATGWTVCDQPPVKFRRTKSMLALPTPIRGGNVHHLQTLLNVENEAWWLILAFMVGNIGSTGPFAHLGLIGNPGSGKSLLARMIRSVFDPNVADLRSLPATERDLAVAIGNSWMPVFDNVSHLTPAMSDALCRVSTGGGFSARKLFSDQDEVVIDIQRPIIMTSVDEVIQQADLLDRTLVVELPSIPDSQRRSEAELLQHFQSALPGILGSLFDVVSVALDCLPLVRIAELPRLADFARFVTAAEPVLRLPGGTFVELMRRNRYRADQLVVEATPAAQELFKFMESRPEWSGAATELLQAMQARLSETVTRSRNWPSGARELSSQLRRVATSLRRLGLDIEFGDRSAAKRLIHVRWAGMPPASAAPHAGH